MSCYTIELSDLNRNYGWYYPYFYTGDTEYFDRIESYHKKYNNLTLEEVQWMLWEGKDVKRENYLVGMRLAFLKMDDKEWSKYIINVLSFLYCEKIEVFEKRQYGTDAIINLEKSKIAIRIKNQKSNKSCIRAVQEIVSGSLVHGASGIIIVGNLNPNGEKLAIANGCHIIWCYSDLLCEICDFYNASLKNDDINQSDKLNRGNFINDLLKNSTIENNHERSLEFWSKRNKIIYKWWKRKAIKAGDEVVEI